MKLAWHQLKGDKNTPDQWRISNGWCSWFSFLKSLKSGSSELKKEKKIAGAIEVSLAIWKWQVCACRMSRDNSFWPISGLFLLQFLVSAQLVWNLDPGDTQKRRWYYPQLLPIENQKRTTPSKMSQAKSCSGNMATVKGLNTYVNVIYRFSLFNTFAITFNILFLLWFLRDIKNYFSIKLQHNLKTFWMHSRPSLCPLTFVL